MSVGSTVPKIDGLTHIKGERVDLGAQDGVPKVIEFWATWCVINLCFPLGSASTACTSITPCVPLLHPLVATHPHCWAGALRAAAPPPRTPLPAAASPRCPPCRSSIPHLTELQHKFKAVRFVGVSTDNDAKRVETFVKQMGDKMDYTVVVDTGGRASAGWWSCRAVALLQLRMQGETTAVVLLNSKQARKQPSFA